MTNDQAPMSTHDVVSSRGWRRAFEHRGIRASLVIRAWPLGIFLLLALFVGLVGGGCIRAIQGPLALPQQYVMAREQLMIHSDFPLARHHRLWEDLTAQRVDISQRLSIPISDEFIHVYLFQDTETFREFIQEHHPDFPQRRAYFVKTDTRLKAYAQWGDHTAEDLRHEVTHGYLHSVIPNLPLWLDEGLAEYFEVARGHRGLNRPHVELLANRIRQGSWQPDLARLEALDPDVDMSLGDYAESWAWVHFLLETDPARSKLLSSYLHALRWQGTAPPLSETLRGQEPEQALMVHLDRLAAQLGE